MNAPLRHFVSPPRALRLRAGLFAAAGLCVGLGGCMANPLKIAPIDPNSAVASDVARLAHENKTFPTFASIPPIPADVRPVRAWGQAARKVEAAGTELAQATAPSTWALADTDTFAAETRKRAGETPANAGSNTPTTEAYAQALRKRATPPPPPKR